MIGSGLKKLAKENGLRVSNGVAYGSLRGYAATLSEGSGFKQIVISTKFSARQAPGASGQAERGQHYPGIPGAEPVLRPQHDSDRFR